MLSLSVAIDDHPHHVTVYIENDNDRELVVSRRAKIEFDVHGDDQHDDAAQIYHTLDELGNIGYVRHGIVAAQFLSLLNIDASTLPGPR